MNFKSLVAAAALIIAALPSAAHATANVDLDGVDISATTDFFASLVKPLTKSVTIYNWSQQSTEHHTSEDFSDALGLSRRFWRSYGTLTQGMYGVGLYGALDPVTTDSFGYGPSWRLLVMDLPIGFRFLDFMQLTSASSKLSQQVSTQLLAFECPTTALPDAFFTDGGAKLSQKCQKLVRKIFQETLQIDGFAYPYGDVPFAECSNDPSVHNRAFVITRDSWMRPEYIRYYTPASTDNLEERVMIESLFLKTASSAIGRGAGTEAIKVYLRQHPTSDFVSGSSTCAGTMCTISARFCADATTCENVTIAVLPRPGGALITSAEAARTTAVHHELLWSDLEGQPKATTVDVFLRKTKFGCDGQLPYDNAN